MQHNQQPHQPVKGLPGNWTVREPCAPRQTTRSYEYRISFQYSKAANWSNQTWVQADNQVHQSLLNGLLVPKRVLRRRLAKVANAERTESLREEEPEKRVMELTSTKSWNKYTPMLVSHRKQWASWTHLSTTFSSELLAKDQDFAFKTRETPSHPEKSRLPSDFSYLVN